MLERELSAAKSEYDEFKAKGLSLDMSRGKPAPDQLDLSSDILNKIDTKSPSGTDTRNYGFPDGLPECRRLFAEVFEVEEGMVIAGGNSSLKMMFDCVAHGMTHGFGSGAWCKLPAVKFLCPSPGYDRHFAVSEYFGIELITVNITGSGPDMEQVKALVESDSAIKGMWCVPKYQNPMGITFSDETVEAIAALRPAAPDFRLFWDNAYVVHHLHTPDHLLNIFTAAAKYGNEDMIFEFGSTSKITYSGAGVAAMCASKSNIDMLKKRLVIESIGPDKINQLRHVKMFPDNATIDAHMKKHAALIAPKFEAVLTALDRNLSELGILKWTNPNGGYFISADTLPGCAARVVELCKNAGVVLTPAGATYPYGKDPNDSNIRIAPTYPTVEELALAVQLFCIAVKVASLEKLISES